MRRIHAAALAVMLAALPALLGLAAQARAEQIGRRPS